MKIQIVILSTLKEKYDVLDAKISAFIRRAKILE